ncbi:MAG: PIN domain-containing protein [Candidatus Kapabacteria bacterium]|nr:PIN domain-containing protein [Candidatus Kapabacteria bacterium]
MKYLLDTNICIYYFKGQFGLNDKFDKIGFDNFAISEITLAELYFGAENSQFIQKNTEIINEFASKIKVIPILGSIRIYAKEKARLKANGNMISDFDLLIGSTAISSNLILISRNIKEFIRLEDLNFENWID